MSASVLVGEDILKYRLLTLRQGLKLEKMGMRLTAKSRSCRAIVKDEFGIKFRDMDKVIEAFDEVLRQKGVIE